MCTVAVVAEKREPWADGITVVAPEIDPPYVPGVRVGRFVVPGRMVATIDHPSLPVRLKLALEIDEVTRAVQLHRLTCTDRITPKGVTGEKLRKLPVERIIRSVLLAAAEDQSGWLVDWTGAGDEFSEALTIGNPEARWSITDELLGEVARVYSQAVANRRRDPVGAVAEHFKRPRPTAARWVKKAREREVLPKTSRGRVRPLTEEL